MNKKIKLQPQDKLAIVVILALNMALGANFYYSYSTEAQGQVQAQPQQSQTDSDGNLTATINGTSFAAGDRIYINGTIEKGGRDSDSKVIIGVYDPDNRTVESVQVSPSPYTGTFQHGFVAGLVLGSDPDYAMRESGNYTVRVQYTPPYLYGQEDPQERVNFTFAYQALQ